MPYFRTITGGIAFHPTNIRANDALLKPIDDQLVRMSQFDKRCELCVADKLHTLDDHAESIVS